MPLGGSIMQYAAGFNRNQSDAGYKIYPMGSVDCCLLVIEKYENRLSTLYFEIRTLSNYPV